ncbi:replicative DNA helicase [Streptomyces diastaticus]
MSIPHQTKDAHPATSEPWADDTPRNTDRTPPQDYEAEQCVLGGMLLSKTAIGEVVEELHSPADFYRPAHQTIYETILDMYGRSEPADPVTVSAELTKRGDIERVGGAPYLHHLVEMVPTAANAQWYAETVAERAVFRRLAETGTRIAQSGYRGEGDAAVAVGTAQEDIFNVLQATDRNDILPISATSASLIDRLEKRADAGDGLRGLSTGFTDLDGLTTGLIGGQLIVIAARPSIGKSTLAVDFLRHCSIVEKKPALFFNLEMPREEIEERILSAQGRVALHHIRSGELDDGDWSRIAKVMPSIEAAPLYIDDYANQTYMEIAARARRMKQLHDIQLIVVDYIQLMKSGGRAETRQQEVADISRNLKLLAKTLNVPIVALSQLNRGPEQRTDKKPMMSDLRESGAIEQDADIVILLHREDFYEKESPRAGEADLIVAKNRNAATATITVAFQGHYSRFTDMEHG